MKKKRKITNLETKLNEIGFKLECKLYCGKHSEKNKGYLFKKTIEQTTFYIELDKTRTSVIDYWFTNNYVEKYDSGILQGLENVLKFLETTIEELVKDEL